MLNELAQYKTAAYVELAFARPNAVAFSSYLANHLLYLQKDSRTVNTPAERGEYEKEESTNPISQPPERTEYTYELEQLQSANTCGVGHGTLAHYSVRNS